MSNFLHDKKDAKKLKKRLSIYKFLRGFFLTQLSQLCYLQKYFCQTFFFSFITEKAKTIVTKVVKKIFIFKYCVFRVAGGILSLPPTSASAEKSFSRHSHIHSADRNRLINRQSFKTSNNLALENIGKLPKSV